MGLLFGNRRCSPRRRLGRILAAIIAAVVVGGWATGVPRERTATVVSLNDGSNTLQVTETHGASPGWIVFGLAPVILIGAIGLKVARGRSSVMPATAVDLTDPATAGRMAEALWTGERYVRIEAEEALIALLPHFGAGDGDRLSEPQRAYLRRALRLPYRRREADLVTAVIGALSEIGDERSIAHIQRLTEDRTRTAIQREVQAFAALRLPILRERAAQNRTERTLLRPSSAPSDTLLRPSDPSADDLLLRPVSREG